MQTFLCTENGSQVLGDVTVISPYPEQCLPVMWSWIQEFEHQMVDDYSPHSYEELQLQSKRQAEGGGKSYAVLKDGLLVGAVWCELLGDGMYMGHLVFNREGLSSGEKVAMTRAVITRIFEDGARKICWQVFADNRTFRIFLRKLGASVEGTFRQSTRRNGELVDVVMMASFPKE